MGAENEPRLPHERDALAPRCSRTTLFSSGFQFSSFRLFHKPLRIYNYAGVFSIANNTGAVACGDRKFDSAPDDMFYRCGCCDFLSTWAGRGVFYVDLAADCGLPFL